MPKIWSLSWKNRVPHQKSTPGGVSFHLSKEGAERFSKKFLDWQDDQLERHGDIPGFAYTKPDWSSWGEITVGEPIEEFLKSDDSEGGAWVPSMPPNSQKTLRNAGVEIFSPKG